VPPLPVVRLRSGFVLLHPPCCHRRPRPRAVWATFPRARESTDPPLFHLFALSLLRFALCFETGHPVFDDCFLFFFFLPPVCNFFSGPSRFFYGVMFPPFRAGLVEFCVFFFFFFFFCVFCDFFIPWFLVTERSCTSRDFIFRTFLGFKLTDKSSLSLPFLTVSFFGRFCFFVSWFNEGRFFFLSREPPVFPFSQSPRFCFLLTMEGTPVFPFGRFLWESY